MPLFLFVILFGLSMDYHVFILTRIREAFDRGMSTEDAVSTLSSVELKQMGIGLAVAVLIDATIIRGVLLPATMKLLGDWNWWLPESLAWLPRLSHEPPVKPLGA